MSSIYSNRNRIRQALNCGRKAKKSKVQFPPVPDRDSITVYDKQSGIQWNGLQLVDLLLPALSAVEMDYMADGSTNGIRWIKRNTNAQRWYRALMGAMGNVIIDVAKLMAKQSFLLKCSHDKVQLPRPAVRKIF